MKRDECSYAFEQYSEQIRSVGMSVRNTFASAEEVCVCVCVCVYLQAVIQQQQSQIRC